MINPLGASCECKVFLFTFDLSVKPFYTNIGLYQQQLLFTTRLSATKVFQIYSSEGKYLQLDKVDEYLTQARLIHCIEVKNFLFANN